MGPLLALALGILGSATDASHPAAAAPMSPATLVVTAVPNPAEASATAAYLEQVGPMIVAGGGTEIRKLRTVEVVHGHPAQLVLVADFPSTSAITDLFSSEAYRALVPTRDASFTELTILVTSPPGQP